MHKIYGRHQKVETVCAQIYEDRIMDIWKNQNY